MSYEKQNFTTGQLLTADALNHMEDGIEQASNMVSPTIVASETSDGTTLIITDANGTKTVTIKNGKDGSGGSSGTLSNTEKSYMLALFYASAYANENMLTTYNALKKLWDATEVTPDPEPSVTEPTSVSLNVSSLRLIANKTYQLTATVLPSNASQTVEWSVSPAGIVSVSGGTVTALKAGDATITAKAGTQTATCTVNVTDNANALYVLPTETTFVPSEQNYIDTGIKMFENAASEDINYTIVYDLVIGENSKNTSDSHALAHCMHEDDPWPGLCIQQISGRLQGNVYTGMTEIAEYSSPANKHVKGALFIRKNQINAYTLKTENIPALTRQYTIDEIKINVSESLLIGAYQKTDGTKGRFFDGTVKRFELYNAILETSKIDEMLS